MVLERAELQIRPGSEEDFGKLLKGRITEILLATPGVLSVRSGRGVENPDTFLILVEWESMEAHGAFKDTPLNPEFRTLFAPYSIGGKMEHFDMGEG